MKYDCEYCGKSKISNRMLTSFKPKTLTNLAFSIEGKKIYIQEKGYGRKFGYVDIYFCPFCGKRLKENWYD